MNIFLIFMLVYFKIFQRLINLTDLGMVLFLNRVIEFIRAIMVHTNLLVSGSWRSPTARPQRAVRVEL